MTIHWALCKRGLLVGFAPSIPRIDQHRACILFPIYPERWLYVDLIALCCALREYHTP